MHPDSQTDVAMADARSPYSSEVRSNQARMTRRAIVAAASDLFVERGYAATTIDAIAERAGVGRKTVFTSVGGKGALLKLAFDWALVGDDEPVPMAERPAVRAMLAERDPRRLVRMWVDMQLDVGSRANPLGGVILAAADVDADARALREMIRSESLVGATAFVTHLSNTGGLRADVSIEAGAEICWALINSLLYHLLVTTRGWSLAAYGAFLVDVMSSALLEPAPRGRQRDRTARDKRAMANAVQVVDDPERQRYEAVVDGRSAGQLSYERTDRLLVLIDTQVDSGADPSVADALVRAAFDDVRAGGVRRVIPVCPYVGWWLRRHPDHHSLVRPETAD